MTNPELFNAIEAQKALMIAVATGGPKIQQVNAQYTQRRLEIADELQRRGLQDPNPHGDLWAWYGRWSGGDMPNWASRRVYVSGLYQSLIDQVRAEGAAAPQVFSEPTGWERVDRSVYEIRRRLEQAKNAEQFQAVGLLCRETLISLAQVVFDPQRHPTLDGVAASQTDAKRMLEAYVAVELAGGANEGVRRHARAALSLANDLQHDRTADFRNAALCAEASTSVVNIVAVISGRRNPQQ